MVWSSFSEFAHMGGYGVYVWGSAAVVFGLMVREVVSLITRKASVISEMAGQAEPDENSAK